MPKKSEKKIAEEFKKTQAEARATYGIPDKKIIEDKKTGFRKGKLIFWLAIFVFLAIAMIIYNLAT